MITTILTLLGGGLGALLRFVPELLKLLSEQREREHEYRMTRLQLEIDRERAKLAIDMVHAQSEASLLTGEASAYIETLRTQARPTGAHWVDVLNATVRPLLTYWWMVLFTVYKVTTIIAAFVFPIFDANTLWGSQDWGVLSMILGFWFVDRALRKQAGR